jgi:hypothetical protein
MAVSQGPPTFATFPRHPILTIPRTLLLSLAFPFSFHLSYRFLLSLERYHIHHPPNMMMLYIRAPGPESRRGWWKIKEQSRRGWQRAAVKASARERMEKKGRDEGA